MNNILVLFQLYMWSDPLTVVANSSGKVRGYWHAPAHLLGTALRVRIH